MDYVITSLQCSCWWPEDYYWINISSIGYSVGKGPIALFAIIFQSCSLIFRSYNFIYRHCSQLRLLISTAFNQPLMKNCFIVTWKRGSLSVYLPFCFPVETWSIRLKFIIYTGGLKNVPYGHEEVGNQIVSSQGMDSVHHIHNTSWHSSFWND